MTVDFDRMAGTWESDDKRARAKQVVSELTQHLALQPSWKVVEFGAGTGVVGRQLAPLVQSIVLVDASTEMMQVAKQLCSQERLTNVTIVHSELAEYSNHHHNTCNLAVMVMALHHIENLAEAIAQLVQVVVPNGYVAIIDLYPDGGTFHHGVEGFDGHNGINPDDIMKLLAQQQYIVEYAAPLAGDSRKFLFIAKHV
jgi:ubiquinone/menaquinone biosynthesis C-methylase UbiE